MHTNLLSNKLLPKVLAFDVFGTVVDWHGSIAAEVARLKIPVDPNVFASAWRNGYKPAMARVRSGELGWTKIDDLHRLILDQVLDQFSIHSLNEAQKVDLNLVWHRLQPWSDSVEGLCKLKQHFTIVTLSNGNLSLLANMAKNAGLPWDLILSAEVFRHYKPDPETYLGVAATFDVKPGEVMLVAAHKDDLVAAHALGLQTAFIERPKEFGPTHQRDDMHREDWVDYHASDFKDLAKQLSL
ncbi:haloacid dehalogenase type II [Polynucleobacter asymbioticus]|uniref:(S)-2-haloacid dehalogenase n=2 Tax=Polynucleobacter asymbioticus TaxID=576611 RepID=A4SYH4_POLAQ|nr:haloacid dehalogenase type II [Polynucleobacter asymbioticus]ABP34538.1 haloacid dehalogenase, type II [Polynucleobacter asymbioticus QLW-P1DMWA-1]APB99216.1 haloacid dehalogenase [Polynucleobacter asymbioticus]APC01516.1 haloacid dehalogenase [Polynucleobacter asymbioticus]APC06379.1 haloacid dehalogenase [Polynucleobacter asymbioticus]